MYFIPFLYNSCHAEVREVHRILMVHVAKKTSDESYMWYGSRLFLLKTKTFLTQTLWESSLSLTILLLELEPISHFRECLR